ncbi:MAG: hypothetical protein CMJ59_21530, partial [Planctomycetaceae bacterium]|nr:hypothetical protein [Planctomycetaceae bacterium]
MQSRRRKLGLESLEARIVLDGAGWLSWDSSPWQNSVNPFDSNGDGAVSPGDAIWIQNAINSMSSGELAGMVAPPALQGLVTDNAASTFLDTNGDGQLSAVDAISIANHINTGGIPAGIFPDGAIGEGMFDMGGEMAELPPFGTNGFGSIASGLENLSDQDAFQVIPSHDRLSITGFEMGGVDIAIQVYNEQQELVADTQSDTFSFPLLGESSAWQERLDLPVEPGQAYSIVIQSGDQGTTGDYVLDLLNYDFEQWSDPDAEQPVSLPPIDAGDSLPDDLAPGEGGLDDTHLTDAGDPTPTFEGGIDDSFGTQGGDPTPTFDGGIDDSFGTQGGDPTPTFDG